MGGASRGQGQGSGHTGHDGASISRVRCRATYRNLFGYNKDTANNKINYDARHKPISKQLYQYIGPSHPVNDEFACSAPIGGGGGVERMIPPVKHLL